MDAMGRDARIDEKIARAAPFARPILEHIRELVHRAVPGVEEAVKWGMPHFTYKGKNIAGMAAFKAHCAFMIQGEGRQGDAAKQGGMGSFGKIADLDDLPAEAELVAKLQEAAARIEEAESAPSRQAPQPKPAMEMPADFASALAAQPSARSFFDQLAPSHRREYLEWITEAKRDETRAKRIGEALAMLADNKRRNWKYER